MQNDISGFRELLWSLFNSYSYVPSNRTGRKGTFPTRRLSENGYRAIMSSLSTIDVLRRFFFEEDEISLLNAQKRLESEKFKEEMWGEALHASALLLDCTDTVLDIDGLKEEDREGKVNNKEKDKEEINPMFDIGYDYDVMQPSSDHSTISWTVFNSVLLLRFSSAFHFRIGEELLEECKDSLQPLVWLVPSPPQGETLKPIDKSKSSSMDHKRPTTTSILLSPLENEKERLNPRSNTSKSSVQGPSGSCSISVIPPAALANFRTSSGGSLNDVECTAVCSGNDINPDVQLPLFPVSKSFPARNHRNEEVKVISKDLGVSTLLAGPGRCIKNTNKMTTKGLCNKERTSSAFSSLTSTKAKSRNTGGLKSQESYTSGETKQTSDNAPLIMKDSLLARSSPPPRSRLRKMSGNVISISNIEKRVATGKGIPIDITKLRQKLAKQDEDCFEWSVGESFHSAASHDAPESPSLAVLAEAFANIPRTTTTQKETEAYRARYDAKVNERYNAHNQSTLHPWKPLTAPSPPSPSPSPNVKEMEWEKKWIVVPVIEEQSREASMCKVKTTVEVIKDYPKNSIMKSTEKREEIKQSEPPTHVEVHKKQSIEFVQQPRKIRGRPLPPPQSPSRRALSRVLCGPRPPVQPVVPRTRGPPTPLVRSKAAEVIG
ncbi:hypothetical protein LSM04_003123 [Trypanosoma melophagium]|uniref:uncharacterized protein n=1 Tax=Trypanosoma melophagium TaxID=715481 RepID=UPI00351A9268|nr:hypothetical protein LSM04_003123 [Trypanosoma melophagium]